MSARSASLAGFVLALLAAAAPAAPAQQLLRDTRGGAGGAKLDSAYVEAIIRVDIENGPGAVLPALIADTSLLLPLRQYFALAEIRVDTFARDSAVAILPGRVRLVFHPRARRIVRGDAPVPYDTLDVTWWDGDLFVASGLLDQLVGTRTAVTWADLSAMVGGSADLPVVVRGRRERRRQLLGRDRPAPSVLDLPLHSRTVDGAIMTWALTAATRGPTEQTSLDLGFGAGLLGGSAELRPRLWSTGGQTSTDLQARWTRIDRRSSLVRQVGVGDVQTAGRRSRLVRGVTLTNAPFVRSSEFDVETFVGDVPPGWEVELYERGRLLGYADADALGAFRVPLELRYGQNPFEVVMYGPGGETVRRHRTIRVPFSRLPSRRVEYAVAAGACRSEPCDGVASADVRYGLARHVTLQGGIDGTWGGVMGSLFQPYAIVSAAPGQAFALTGEAVANGQLRAAADYEPSLDLHLEAAHTRFSEAGARATGGLVEAARTEATAFWRPGSMDGQLYLRATALRSTGPDMRRTLGRVSVTTRVGAVRYGLGVLHDASRWTGGRRSGQLAFDASADALLGGPWPWLRSTSAQAQLAVDPGRGLTALRGSAGRRATRVFRVDAALGWFRGSGASLELSLTSDLPGPRAGVRARATAATGAEALTFSYGSLAWDPRHADARLGDGSDLGRAGIRGVLFRDDNDNGVRDAGEPGLAGIPVHIGGWNARTDSAGRFSAWGLYPTEPADIEFDTLSFGDPRYILPAPVLRVRPNANAFGLVAVPVTIGGEISGYVGMGDQPLAGVPVLLREMNTGVVIRTVSFADGAFYHAAVPPGEYEVTLPDDVLERLHAFTPPLSIFVPPGPAEKRFEDLQLRLVPRP